MNKNNQNDSGSAITILFAAYGIGELIHDISEIKDDYLLYLFDKNYNLLDIITPYEL